MRRALNKHVSMLRHAEELSPMLTPIKKMRTWAELLDAESTLRGRADAETQKYIVPDM